jgi:hypothetical protein
VKFCPEKSDRLDQNLAEVAVDPKKFLKGPLAKASKAYLSQRTFTEGCTMIMAPY